MSQQQVVQNRPSTAIGFSRRRADRDLGNHFDNKLVQLSRSGSGAYGNTGTSHASYNHSGTESIGYANNNMNIEEASVCGSRDGGPDKTLHDRLLFMTMCLIGLPVEVQVKNGAIYSGIFHTACAEKDYGVVLKMARLIKDGSSKGGKGDAFKDITKKDPIKTLIILSKDLVQVTAKDVLLTGDVPANLRARDNRHDIIIDSFLSQTCHIEGERELKPWTPDNDVPQSLGLENTFQNTWNRNWDQFETNKALFGVESTFDEELYTTKLERGPGMRELERKASETAREIEEQETDDFHLAEERCRHVKEVLNEERRFSSVLRKQDEDIGEDNEDGYVDRRNEETFGSDFTYTSSVPSISSDSHKTMHTVNESGKEVSLPCQEGEGSILNVSLIKHAIDRQANELKLQEIVKGIKQQHEDKDLRCSHDVLKDKTQKALEPHASNVPTSAKKSTVDTGSVPKAEKSGHTQRGSGFPSATSSKDSLVNQPISPQAESPLTSRTGSLGSSVAEVSSSCSSACVASPSSSVGSACSRKSTLNPNAKEFKLNPNAKTFTASFSSVATPVVQGPVYMPGSIHPLVPMHGVPAGIDMSSLMQQSAQPVKLAQYNNAMTPAGVSGTPYPQTVGTFAPATALPLQTAFKIPSSGPQQIMGQPYSGQQPIRYNNAQPPPVQPAPGYIHPNAQLYPQQMMFGQPGQVVYVQPFPQEMMQGVPMPSSQGLIPLQSASQPAQQPKHRGPAVQGMQLCIAPPLMSGQQSFVQPPQFSHLPMSRPSPGVHGPTSMPGIQNPQVVVAGLGTSAQNNSGSNIVNGMRGGGRGTPENFQ